MKSGTILMLLVATMACGCSEKKQSEQVAPLSVKTMTVGTGATANAQAYTGTVEEMNGVALSFQTGGTLKKLLVDEGQTVEKGQLIAVTDGQNARNSLETAQAAVRTAQAAYDQAQDAYKRMRMMHDKGSLADIRWVEAQSNLERAQAALEGARAQARIATKSVGDTHLHAPFGGYITHKNVEIGQTITPGLAVVNLVRIDRVKVKISVPESEITRLTDGSAVRIRVDALGGRTYTGRVTEKNVSADALSHTYEVKAVVDNADHQLLPGMIAEVEVPGSTTSAQTLLPAEAVELNFDNRNFVWTVTGSKARKTFVTVDGNMGDRVIIGSGLQIGDTVIVKGQQKVSAGMDVTEK